jgi:hypothetical protein
MSGVGRGKGALAGFFKNPDSPCLYGKIWLPFQDTSRTILRFATDEARRTISRYRAMLKTPSSSRSSKASDFAQGVPPLPAREPANGVRKRDRDRAERIRLLGGPAPTLRDRAVALALTRGEVRTRDLTSIGVPRCYLSKMCDEGLLVRVGHGRYRATKSTAA